MSIASCHADPGVETGPDPTTCALVRTSRRARGLVMLLAAVALTMVATFGPTGTAGAERASWTSTDAHEDATVRGSHTTVAPDRHTAIPAEAASAERTATSDTPAAPPSAPHVPAPVTGEPPGRAPPIHA